MNTYEEAGSRLNFAGEIRIDILHSQNAGGKRNGPEVRRQTVGVSLSLEPGRFKNEIVGYKGKGEG